MAASTAGRRSAVMVSFKAMKNAMMAMQSTMMNVRCSVDALLVVMAMCKKAKPVMTPTTTTWIHAPMIAI